MGLKAGPAVTQIDGLSLTCNDPIKAPSRGPNLYQSMPVQSLTIYLIKTMVA
jgi:hypothetical protein